ncbi:hypothetical protein ABPG75_002536 [Micractinium tetrahymenae]
MNEEEAFFAILAAAAAVSPSRPVTHAWDRCPQPRRQTLPAMAAVSAAAALLVRRQACRPTSRLLDGAASLSAQQLRGLAGQSEGQAPWVLVQSEGGSSTTASDDGGGGGVRLERTYDSGSIGGSAEQAAAPRFSLSRLRQEALSQLQATFLPSGYPHTVAPGYLRNTLWQAAHHCAGSANGVLASTFLLYSVGLGAGAVPTAGALNWVLKDGLGQLGTLLFGKAIAHRFDVSSRAWYLLASLKLNLAMGIEICTFLLPQYFLPMGAVANAIKGLSWMAGGSTKSVFKVSFAADNNFGDISAKATSQTIFSSVLGTAAGVTLASQLEQSVGLALYCYAALASLHMYTGYQAVRCVPIATLNPSRLELLVQQYLEQLQEGQQAPQQAAGQQQPQQGQQAQQSQHHIKWSPGHAAPSEAWPAGGQQQQPAASSFSDSTGAAGAAAVRLPTPAELAAVDPVFHRPWVCVGTPLQQLVRLHGSRLGQLLHQQVGQQSAEQQRQEVQQGEGQPEAAAAAGDPPQQLHMLVPCGGSMHLLLHEQATAADSILGFLHAFVLQHGTSGSMSSGAARCGQSAPAAPAAGGSSEGDGPCASAEQLRGSLAEARRLLPGLLASLEAAGWDNAKVVLEAKRRRVTW